MFAKAPDDEWDFVLGDLRIFPVGPKALGVEIPERLSGQFNPALADFGVTQGLISLGHHGDDTPAGRGRQVWKPLLGVV
ncbi:MAG TPA: hypothetical protein VFC07_05015 [Verrucomicrobiae bacterium]|nr:hypothetical protein [Verrucomicrobiae bacterium]